LPLSLFQKEEAVSPYSHLANIYDFVMRHVDYRRWALYLQKLFSKTPLAVRHVLDISCGTGNLLTELCNLGYVCAGFDYSPGMSKVAAMKMSRKQRPTAIWTADMRRFSLRRQYEALVCTYDSINYCIEPERYGQVMASVAGALKSGGVFIFDVSTVKNSRRYFQNYYDRGGNDEFDYIRISNFDRRQQIQINEFYVSYKAQPRKSYHERHEQKIYALDAVRKLVPQELFEITGVYDGFSLRPGTEKSDRVHFVLTKK